MPCITPIYFVRQSEHKSSSDSGFYLVKNYYNNSCYGKASSFHNKYTFSGFPSARKSPNMYNLHCLGIQSSGNICWLDKSCICNIRMLDKWISKFSLWFQDQQKHVPCNCTQQYYVHSSSVEIWTGTNL